MRLALAFLAFALAACAAQPAGPPPQPTRRTTAIIGYGCADGETIIAAFLMSPQEVELTFADGGKMKLPHVRAASGARYSSATHEFWTKGEGALYTIGAAAPVQCHKSN